MTFHITFLT